MLLAEVVAASACVARHRLHTHGWLFGVADGASRNGNVKARLLIVLYKDGR